MDITQLILEDHHEQRRLFAMLEQVGSDVPALTAIWSRLSKHMEAHVQGEEEIFYPELLKSGRNANGGNSAADETLDAIKDHNEIRDGMVAVSAQAVGTEAWFAAVKQVNEANSDHMGEEEREGLTDFRRAAPLDLRHALAVRFAAFEASHVGGVTTVDKDPAQYVSTNG